MTDPANSVEFVAWTCPHCRRQKWRSPIFLDRLFEAFGQRGCLEVGRARDIAGERSGLDRRASTRMSSSRIFGQCRD